jgi:membrane-associated phospholipid phosphatase
MRKFILTLAMMMVASGAFAQSTVVDPNLAWDSHRSAAATVSNLTVASSLTLDTWTSWQSADRKHAFVKQAERTAVILGVSEAVKRLVHRTRLDGSDNLSFYSEHTAFAASAMGGPRLAFTLPLTFGTGYLRVAADKHYVTDTLVGAVVGGLAGKYIR